MAAPVPVTSLFQNGKYFVASWSGVWAGTGEFTDSTIVDLSALKYTNKMRISTIHVSATAGISALLEFDGNTSGDKLIYQHQLGNTGNVVLDFTSMDGLAFDSQVADDSGDIVLTTLSAADTDAISIVVVGRCA
tara:strand:- start:3086 stop:3487 length:402 start_codon:yes stop_codon:yes gene_type:complete